MSRAAKRSADLGLAAITIEGGLISPDQVQAIVSAAPDAKMAADYGCPKGTNLRDEITRYFRIAQAHWQTFDRLTDATTTQTAAFVKGLLEQAFGFTLTGPHNHHREDRRFTIAWEAKGGRVPIAVAPPAPLVKGVPGDGFARALPEFGDGESGRIHRRSATVLLQDWLNANDAALWGLVFAGDRLRLMRDNASLTRPAWIEVDLAAIFRDDMFADFTALWLLIHSSRFGAEGEPQSDSPLERWREAGMRAGSAAREKLRDNVEGALIALGQGILDANPGIHDRLDSGHLALPHLFEQMLRVVYRLIFLAVAEDRNLLHPTTTSKIVHDLYAANYGFGHLRDRSTKRHARDHHFDAWEGTKVVFRTLLRGEGKLGLPALGGLFDHGLTPDLDTAKIPNAAFLDAAYKLAWLMEESRRVRINWRDMATEELGSVYEGLLELVPVREDAGRTFAFAGGSEARGNARKKSGSYYTPDSLVQRLLDSTLDPILDRAEASGGDHAILNLNIIDPACGSGHFLLGAARRAATRVAQIRNPDAPDYNAAMRDVVRNCIHGVDRNPMAVELAKVALWIESVEPGKPLGFLDANIQCGDSLLGVFDLKVLEEGVPDEAYKPLAGDDKDTAKYYAKRNKDEKKGQGCFDFLAGGGSLPPARLAAAMDELHHLPEDTVAQVEDKRRRFAAWAADPKRYATKVACDLYMAAFLMPKVNGAPASTGAAMIPTTSHVRAKLGGGNVYGLLEGAAVDCAEAARVFHWPLAFPEVIVGRGGFDVVIGNPPWERVKLQEEEFFAVRAPDIANAKNAAARKTMIAELDTVDPWLATEWATAVRNAAAESHFMRQSGRFPLGGVGDVNTYAVFTDHFRQLVAKTGRAGLIIPNGLVTGFTYREFLKVLLDSKSLVSFFGFENEDKLFKSVHNETKFGLLTVSGGNEEIEQPWFTAHLRQPDQIDDPARRYALTVEQIQAINPNTLNLPAFRWARDAEVAAAIHSAAPVLIRRTDDGIENPWRISFQRMFDMANDSGLFLDHDDIGPLIIERQGALAILADGRKVYPLYEGKMFWHFDHRYGTYEDQTEKQENKGVLPRVSDDQHVSCSYRIQPRYWIEYRDIVDRFENNCDYRWAYSWRDVGISERTFIGTALPKTAVGHVAPIILTPVTSALRAALFANLSSLAVDYAARQKSMRMTFFVIEQLPVLHPRDIEKFFDFLGESFSEWASKRALELFYTNIEMQPMAEDLGRTHPPFRWDPRRRILLQAEIDAAVLHLYRLDKDQAEWLLDSFSVLRKYEERDLGEFRTKRLVLEIYDEMAAARADGRAYETRLSPPPADPSCCHPAAVEAVA